MKNIFKRKFRDADFNSNVDAVLVAIFILFTVLIVTLVSIAFIDWSMNGLLIAILLLVTFLITIGWIRSEPDNK